MTVMIAIRVTMTIIIFLVFSSNVDMLGISKAHSSKMKQNMRKISHMRKIFILFSFEFGFYAIDSKDSELN